MPWAAGDDLSATNLNNYGASATSVTGYSTNTLRPETGTLITTTERLTVANDTGASVAMSVLSTSNLAVVTANVNSTWAGLSLYPPDNFLRNKISLYGFTNAFPSDITYRALGIESHGTADTNNDQKNHVTFYTTDGGASRKVFEWHWGSQWSSNASTLYLPSVENLSVGWIDVASGRPVCISMASSLSLVNSGGTFGISGPTNVGGSAISDARQRLVVGRSDSGDVWLVLMENSGSGNGELHFQKSHLATTQTRGRLRYEYDNDKMEFWTAAAERGSFDSVGNFAVTQSLSVTSQTGATPSLSSGRGYFWVDSASSLYWVNGSGVSTLVA